MNAKIVAICLTAFLYVAVSAQNFWDEFRANLSFAIICTKNSRFVA